MKLYFDTNIYDFISDKQEDKVIYDFLSNNNLNLEASSTNLMETYAIPDPNICKRQLETLTITATSFEKKPESWWQAREILSEIKRINPHWLRQPASQKLIVQEKKFLQAHLRRWEEARNLYIPNPSEISKYRRDFESGVSKTTLAQKTYRQRLLKNELDLNLAYQKDGKINNILEGNFLEPDLFWRIECLITWFEAISKKIPESRDYADWLLPYIRDNAFGAPTYPDFWLNRVKEKNVPRNRMSSLVYLYQMKYKVTHGNSNDQEHACHVFDVDVFLTADKAFYKTLEWAIPHFTDTAKITFIDRRAPSPFEEITRAIL